MELTPMHKMIETVRFKHGVDVVACDIDGGKALLDMKSSNYYKLNRSAALVWDWVGEGADISELTDKMVGEFDVEPDECIADVRAVLESFVGAGLLERDG
jgi:hypothetical protein